MKQNIYDDEVFFEGYRKLRENPNSANNIIEKPAIFSLLPDLRGKSVVDLGCGYGENCKAFVSMGADKVVGIDISQKMLEVAKSENASGNISYKNMCLENISDIGERFDVAISSLAVHYVEDFIKLAKDVYDLLNPTGVFIFSQEHPFTTAPLAGAGWIKDPNGRTECYRLSDYSVSGIRNVAWIVDNVVKYHRTFSDIINWLIAAGFHIKNVVEPVASRETIEKLPGYANNLHKPDFLIVEAGK